MLKGFKFFLASPSLAGMRIKRVFKVTKESGYDGVEVMMTNYVLRNLDYITELAEESGLELTFHQPWEGSYSIFNRVLQRLGKLPKNFQKVSDLLPSGFSYPVVIQSWRWKEAKENDNYRVQIIFDPIGQFENLPLSVLIGEFLKNDVKVVFDILYHVEYYYGGLKNIPQDREEIFKVLIQGWDKLRSLVKEIHYYGAETKRGLWRKNLFFSGILPVDRFIQYVAESGWRGTIVFEMNPLILYPMCLLPGSLKRTFNIQRSGTRAMITSGLLGRKIKEEEVVVMNEQERKRWREEAFRFFEAYLKIAREDLEKARSKRFWIFGKEKVRKLEGKVKCGRKAIGDLKNGSLSSAIKIINTFLSKPAVAPFEVLPEWDEFLDRCRHKAALGKIKKALQKT